MILRPRQKIFVKKCCDALRKHKNTLGVANTGFGKTVALSAILGNRLKRGKALIMAHRDELTAQNSNTFSKINPNIPISFFNASTKNFKGQTVFSMVQTLSRDENLAELPSFDMVVIDEAHHAPSFSYRKVIDAAYRKNKKLELLGVTATPERSDSKGLKGIFNNVADIVTIGEMVRAGHLVEPRAMVVDIGTQNQLRRVKKTANEYNQAEVEAIQNTTFNNTQIVEKWMETASDRQTVVFCSTIKHAQDVAEAFSDAGIKAKTIHGKLGKKERSERLRAFDRGDIQILCNPAVLTEGWDSPICSCVVLLRISSHKSTMIQMVGRGLRKINPQQYPDVRKRDCLILDFGISLLQHGDLNADIFLSNDSEAEKKEQKKKDCPECGSEIPLYSKVCSICGYEFKVETDLSGFYDVVEEFRLIELELIKKSPFRWVELFSTSKIIVCTGFNAWACVCSKDEQDWFAFGGISAEKKSVSLLDISTRRNAIASADDFMRQNEKERSAKKTALWMQQPASVKQYELLNKIGIKNLGLTKVEAAAYLTFKFNQHKIEKLAGF